MLYIERTLDLESVATTLNINLNTASGNPSLVTLSLYFHLSHLETVLDQIICQFAIKTVLILEYKEITKVKE